MAARREKIKVVSYVHVGETTVNTEELTQDQRRRLATELTLRWLNELYRGTAEFYTRAEGTAAR